MDQQHIDASTADSVWPELSANVSVAQGTARSITLDTQRATADGRILEITAQLEEMRSRLSSVEQQISQDDTSTQDDELLPRFAALDENLGATTARFEELATQVARAEENISSTMIATIEGFDSRLALVEDARLTQSNELNELTGYLEQAFTRITELAEVIEEERAANASTDTEADWASSGAIESVQAQVDAVGRTVADLSQQLEHASLAIDSSTNQIDEALSASVAELDARVAATEARLSDLDGVSTSIEFLNSRADALERQQMQVAGEADRHRSDIIEHVDSAHARIDGAELELLELRTQIAQPQVQPPDLTDDVNELRETVGTAIEAQRELANSQIDAQEHIDANRRAIERADALSATSRELVHDVSDRITNLSETADLIGHRVDLVQDATEDLQSRVESVRSTNESTVAHVQKLDQGMQNLDGRLDNAAVGLDAAHTRIDETTTRSNESHQRLDELGERFTSFDARLSQTDDRIESVEQSATDAVQRSSQLSAKLDQTIDCIEGAVSATADIAGRVAATESQISANNDEFIATREHLESSVSRADEIASRALSISEGLQQSIHAGVEERTENLREHLLNRVDEARAQLQHALETSQAESTHARHEFESSLSDRLSTVQESVENRLSEVVQSVNNDTRIETLESTVASVQDHANEAIGAAQEAAGVASEAYAFSDSLRQLQTDIVQAIQDELRMHGGQLRSYGERLAHVESSGTGFASAERVQMLEAKLVEALQTLSQLTQLQRRNTSVEAQLTDTLTATSHGVESTQANVAMLREDLVAAQNRIATLERLLADAEAVSHQPQQSPMSLEDVSFDHTETPATPQPTPIPAASDADTGWFTESYERKNQEPRAS